VRWRPSSRPPPRAQALKLQCAVFRRGAAALAEEGSEEDLAVLGTVLVVGDACEAVEAVSRGSIWGIGALVLGYLYLDIGIMSSCVLGIGSYWCICVLAGVVRAGRVPGAGGGGGAWAGGRVCLRDRG
jgi:hypothetical protein